ncbi:Annexin A6 [Phlyctochytrium bullatum]|nr:Annexin A6 [Phlyctochytrium bullatum]
MDDDNPVQVAFDVLKSDLHDLLTKHIKDQGRFMDFQVLEEHIDNVLIDSMEMFSLQPNQGEIMQQLQVQLNDVARILLLSYEDTCYNDIKRMVNEKGLSVLSSAIQSGQVATEEDVHAGLQKFLDSCWVRSSRHPTQRVREKIIELVRTEVREPGLRLLAQKKAQQGSVSSIGSGSSSGPVPSTVPTMNTSITLQGHSSHLSLHIDTAGHWDNPPAHSHPFGLLNDSGRYSIASPIGTMSTVSSHPSTTNRAPSSLSSSGGSASPYLAPASPSTGVPQYAPISLTLNHFTPNAAPAPTPLRPETYANDINILKSTLSKIKAETANIVNILGCRSPEQMRELAKMYHATTGVMLAAAIKEKTFEEFSKLAEGLCAMSLEEFDVACIVNAFSGFGTDRPALIQVFVGRTNAELQAMKAHFTARSPQVTLSAYLEDKAGALGSVIKVLLENAREEDALATTAANASDTAGWFHSQLSAAGKLTKEAIKGIIERLSTLSFDHIRQSSMVYSRTFHPKDDTKLSESLNKTKGLPDDVKMLLVALVEWAEDAHLYVAKQYHHALKGLGNIQFTIDREALIRLAVRYRSVEFAKKVNIVFLDNFNVPLTRRLEEKLKAGEFRELIIKCAEGL